MTVAVGRKGVGKTIETIKFIYQYVSGTSKMKPRKALIFDVNNEFSSFDFPMPNGEMAKHKISRLLIKDLPRFTASNVIEVRRIAPYWDNNTLMSRDEYSKALEIIFTGYRDGLLLMEDINLYTNESMKGDLLGRLVTLRHIGIDVVIHYQGVGKVFTPTILANTGFLRMHKTNDTVARHINKDLSKRDILCIAENIVNKRYYNGQKNGTNDKYFNLLIDIENNKIYNSGNFRINQEEVEDAIRNYISTYKSSILPPILNQIDRNGNNIYTLKTGIAHLEQSFFDDMFVFKR